MKKFEPCAFCGAKENITVDVMESENPIRHAVKCGNCRSQTAFYVSKYYAIKKWNEESKNGDGSNLYRYS